jgi:hypothetical protein
MSLEGLVCQVSKSANSDACPRPTTRTVVERLACPIDQPSWTGAPKLPIGRMLGSASVRMSSQSQPTRAICWLCPVPKSSQSALGGTTPIQNRFIEKRNTMENFEGRLCGAGRAERWKGLRPSSSQIGLQMWLQLKSTMPGVITPAQPGGATIGNFHAIAYRFNGKQVGILWNSCGQRGCLGAAPLAPLS